MLKFLLNNDYNYFVLKEAMIVNNVSEKYCGAKLNVWLN